MENSKNDNSLMPNSRSNGILVEYDKTKNSYLLIGGSDRNQAYNDSWLLLINDKKWEKISINKLTETLTPRIGVAYTVIENNDNKLILCIHGGQDFFTQTFFSDMLFLSIDKLNLEKSEIINKTILPLDITKNPCERNSHCMLLDKNKNKLYIFGGGTKDKLLNDLWFYDLNKKEFELININEINKIIQPRELFGMSLHENKILIFGGRLMDGIDKNSYIINLEDKTCKIGAKMPFALCAFSFVKINYENEYYIIIYGGTDGNMFSNNFVVYDFKNSCFKKSKLIINKNLVNNDPNLSVFLGRISTMMSYDENNQNIILYGGSACDKEWNYINSVPVKDILNEL